MFVCPHCDEKIHWKYSLVIKPGSMITCVACGSGLTPVRSSYNKAAVLTTLILFVFLLWVILSDTVFLNVIALPLLIVCVPALFYYIIRFEKTAENEEKY